MFGSLSTGASAQQLTFVDRKGAFMKLAMRGAFLELVTFGFYRFWLNTDIRRHLWAHTAIAGDGLEYTGRARELLMGFLMALAILAPVYFGYFLIGVEAERTKAFASTPLVAIFFLFGQFAVYRARRYRLTRTTWRGVRFWMQGSGLGYMCLAAGWTLLVRASLGFAYPWRAAALERYKMRRTFYGDLRGEFAGDGRDFFRRAWWIWLTMGPLASGMLLAIAYSASAIDRAIKAWPTASGLAEARILAFGASGLAIPLLVGLLILALYARFKTIEWRWWTEGLRIGPMSFETSLQQRQYFGLLAQFILAFLPILLILGGLVYYGIAHDPSFHKAFGAAQAKQQHLAPQAQGGLPLFSLFILPAYVLFLFSFGTLNRYFMQHHYWRMIVASLAIRNSEAAADVAQSGEAASALGEGLADGLDVAGF
jgi:uncharacterized membrane protein YjgN (DUF898 family)